MNVQQKLKKAKGFTLIELVIVVVIIGILATISVPIYRGYMRRARAAEGSALIGAVAHAEKAYFSEHNVYIGLSNVSSAVNSDNIAVDPSTNRYFRSYTVTAAGGGFTVTTSADNADPDVSGISVTYTQGAGAAPVIATNGL